MRLKKTIAGFATGVLVAASTLLIAAPASAADYYPTEAELQVPETNPYTPGWFSGSIPTAELGSFTKTPNGLEIAGKYQILNADTPDTDLAALVNGAHLRVTAGEAWFQIPVFFDAGGTSVAFTTLRTLIEPGTNSVGENGWEASQNFAQGALPTSGTLDDYLNIFEAGSDPYEILAFGFFVDTAQTATVASITWAGNTHWFVGPITATISDSEVTVDEIQDPGITATFSGFIPGEEVEGYYGGGSWGDSAGSFTADADGNVTVPLATDLGVGTYQLGAYSVTTGASASVAFSVTAAELAATGAESAPLMIGGAALLLLGVGAFVISRRGKRA